jgi:lipoprotein-anchoring transpeptidase ErfK/SrfK
MFKKKVVIPSYIVLAASILVSFLLIFSVSRFIKSRNAGKYDNLKTTAIFNGKTYRVPPEITQPTLSYEDVVIDIEDLISSDVLGSSSNKEKRIEVDLSNQKLYAYEGDKKKMSFSVSTGKWALTPTGEYRIWSKLKYTLMTGGSKAYGTYYYLPNVPYTMYFYQGYGIHGAYWHDNFGHPMSHGCVNMKISDAEKLFYWAKPNVPSDKNSISSSKSNPGTKVVIYGTTPRE